ncbi:hypothetical protein [Streptomyces sp. NPDC003480]
MELLDVLAELARSGHLGPVENGAAWDQITAALGEPWEVTVGKRRSWPRLYAYGDLELTVCRCQKITLICLQTWRDVIDVPTGLDVDDTAELLYRDWMRIEHAAGNRSGLHTAVTRIQRINQALDCSLEMETTQLINALLNGSGTEVRRAL